jgi:hypothetical protein
MKLRLHVGSLNPYTAVASNQPLQVRVWADPDWEAGTAAVTPIADMGNGISVLYGSAEAPSGFSLPTRVPVEH